MTEVIAKDVIELYDLFLRNGIEVWIDGGWGVDALLGRQTRLHADLDIAVKHSNVPLLRSLLEASGYREVPRDDTRDCNFVLGDENGRQVDVHSFELDADGNNIFGVAYRAEHLTGEGMIENRSVRCVPPEWSVKFHTGYHLDSNDFLDVKALCEKFRIEMPEEHKLHWQFLVENQIRDETERDYSAIYELHRLAFGGEAEAKLVDDLRQSHDAIISLVAERNKQIIGHVLFSKLEAPMKALGLAPVGVHPAFQKQGVGSALIREGLHQAKKKAGCAFSFLVIRFIIDVSDFVWTLQRDTPARIPAIILWLCHSRTFHSPLPKLAKSVIRNLSNYWIKDDKKYSPPVCL